jgi:hypothetical protein
MVDSNIQWDGIVLQMFYQNFITIMAPTNKLTKKIETFLWTEECQKPWELIKQKYIDALILITKLAGGISCSYRCILVRCGGYAILECNREK